MRYTYLFFTLLGVFSFSLHGTPNSHLNEESDEQKFKAEKVLIDTVAVSEDGNPKQQIQSIYAYTIDQLKKWKNPYSKSVLQITQNSSGYVKTIYPTYPFYVAYGALHHLKYFSELQKPSRTNVIQALYSAALLLSPNLHKRYFSYGINAHPYQSAHSKAHNTYWYGRILLSYTQGEQSEIYTETGKTAQQIQQFCESEAEASLSTTFKMTYFKPLILMGSQATFSYKGSVYALSKGILLYGLTDKPTDAHGGIYPDPLTFAIHDSAHGNNIIRPWGYTTKGQEISRYRKPQIDSFVTYLLKLTGQIYNLIEKDLIFKTPKTKKRAWIAAFDLFHEHSLYKLIPQISPPKSQPPLSPLAAFAILYKGLLSRILEIKKHNPIKKVGDFVSRSLRESTPYEKFCIRFFSDFAQNAKFLFPDYTVQLYPFPDSDKTLDYNPNMVIKLLSIHYTWFYTRISNYL